MSRIALLLVGVAAVAAGPALATDLTSPSSVWNWSGLYVGVHGGFGGDKFTYPFNYSDPPDFVSGSLSLNSSGFYGGGQIGYNWQFSPNWVAGLEADINASGIEGKISGNAIYDFGPSGSVSGSAGSKVDYFGTVRGRVGWTNGPLLLYATGGFAYGDVTSSINGTASGSLSGTFNVSQTNHHAGWTIGGGVEYALTRNLSLKTEYKWVDLGTKNLISTPLLGGTASLDETTRFHTIEVGLNYRF
jgi:outer membrane immunogenic protein